MALTIGGNDVGFSDFASSCVWPLGSRCDAGAPTYYTTTNDIATILPSLLKSTYEHILQDAPNAKVYVLGYPFVLGVKSTSDPYDARCPYLYNGATAWGNAQAARDVITNLDATISGTILTVQNEKPDYASRLHYVDVNGSSSPFTGHGICDSGSSYFLNVDNAVVGNKEYVFHPNASGQAAYAQLVASAINAG